MSHDIFVDFLIFFSGYAYIAESNGLDFPLIYEVLLFQLKNGKLFLNLRIEFIPPSFVQFTNKRTYCNKRTVIDLITLEA